MGLLSVSASPLWPDLHHVGLANHDPSERRLRRWPIVSHPSPSLSLRFLATFSPNLLLDYLHAARPSAASGRRGGSSRVDRTGNRNFFPPRGLGAGPRARARARAAGGRPEPDAVVGDSVGSGRVVAPCRGHWHDNAGRPASGATDRPPAGSRGNSSEPGAEWGRTSVRSP